MALASAAARRLLSGGRGTSGATGGRASLRACSAVAGARTSLPPTRLACPDGGLAISAYRPLSTTRCTASATPNAGAAPAVVFGPAAAAGIPPHTFVVVNFYHLVDVEDPAQLHAAHADKLSTLDIAGRIYITPQGINAQFSGPAADADAYVAWAAAQPGFATMAPSAEPAPGGVHLFPRLRLKLKPDLISLAGGCGRLPITDPAARAKPLTPDEWAAMLALANGGRGSDAGGGPPPPGPAPIVLDVRNGYEWDAGHFAGAARPLEENFNETPTDVSPAARPPGSMPAGRAGPAAAAAAAADSESEEDESTTQSSSSSLPIPAHLAHAPRDAPVMMYCTGGIRCDVYSTHLAQQGFTNLYTLEGGVHRYFRERGGEGWKGSLFVFDARMAVAPDGRTGADAAVAGGGGAAAAPDPLPSASPCAICGGAATLPHLNCANIDCNKLFISCRACAAERAGCCCEACMAAPRLLRPAKFSGQYGTWAAEITGEGAGVLAGGRARRDGPGPPPDAAERMASGRGDGRLARRRARAARAAAARAAGRDERAARKAAARAAAAERGDGADDEAGGGPSADRLARLAALRERLRATPTGGGDRSPSPSELVAEWAAPCPACGSPVGAVTRIARLGSGDDAASTSTVIAADACDACGWRGPVSSWSDGEAGGAPLSSPFTLRVSSAAAAAAPLPPIPRSAAVSIPELGLELAPGSAAVAGAATPAGLLAAVRADLGGKRVGGGGGGGAGESSEWAAFWARFAAAESLASPWSLVVSAGED